MSKVRVKLDENFPPSAVQILEQNGIDASSVFHQQISGTNDDNLYQLCLAEQRILVTFDLDFSNIIRYPTINTPGIVVYRKSKNFSLQEILALTQQIAKLLLNIELSQNLVIIDNQKVRVRKPAV